MEKYSVDKENDSLEKRAAELSKTAEVKPEDRAKALKEIDDDRRAKDTGERS